MTRYRILFAAPESGEVIELSWYATEDQVPVVKAVARALEASGDFANISLTSTRDMEEEYR